MIYTPPTLRKDLYSSCMEALDDIGWDYGFSFSSYGVQLGLRVTDVDLLELLRDHQPFASDYSDAKIVDRLFSVVAMGNVPSKGARYNLYWDQSLFAKKVPINELCTTFSSLTSLAVAELSEKKLFIHCGVVGWKDKAILIPGRTHVGKSTLVHELVKAGASYYSDEFAVLDNEGCISAYPRPLSMRQPLTRKQQDVPVENIGGTIGHERLPVGLVILTEYKKKETWKPENVSAGNGLLVLLDNTHSARRSPRRAMEILKLAVDDATILSGPRGNASETARMILAEI